MTITCSLEGTSQPTIPMRIIFIVCDTRITGHFHIAIVHRGQDLAMVAPVIRGTKLPCNEARRVCMFRVRDCWPFSHHNYADLRSETCDRSPLS